MSHTNEIKSIMKKLRECQKEADELVNESVAKVKNEDANPADNSRAVSEALKPVNEEDDSENDASESDLLLARLEDILARFEKVIAVADGEGEEEEPAEEEPAEEEGEEEPAEEESEEEPAEEEEGTEESYERSLEERLAALERKFTESRRRALCRSFRRR